MTNTRINPIVTPDDVELVHLSDLERGDIIVDFTPVSRDVVTPPTQRQLNRPVRGYSRIATMTFGTVAELTRTALARNNHNPAISYTTSATSATDRPGMGVPYAPVWRVRRSFVDRWPSYVKSLYTS